MADGNARIIIDADSSGYVAAVAQAAAASKQLAAAENQAATAAKSLEKEQASATRAAEKAAAAAAKQAQKQAELEAKSKTLEARLRVLHKINESTGGTFSAITGPLNNYAELLEKVGPRQAAMGAAAGVAAGLVVKLSGAVYDVFANLENYRDSLNSLQGRGIISAADVQGLEKASAAMTALSSQMGGWATEIAVRIAPTVSKFLMGTAYALQYVESLIRTWSFTQANKDAMAAARELYDAMEAVKVKTEQTTGANQAHTVAVRSSSSAQADAARAAEERTRRLEEEGRALDDLIAKDAKRSAQASADAASLAAFHAQPQGAQDAQQGVQTGGGEMGGIGFRMQELDWSEDPLISQDQARADNAKKTSQEWAQHWQSGIGTAAGAFEQFAQIAVQVGSAIIAGTEKDTKKAKKKQFALEKAAALSIATIQTFQAVVQALGSTAPPASFVLAALAGAAGAVQIGMIAAQQPKFHRGGILPDEVDRQGYRARQNESTVVLTAQAMQMLGGQEGVNRANAGQSVAGGDTYLVVDGVPRKARQFAGPDPGFGIARRGMGAYA